MRKEICLIIIGVFIGQGIVGCRHSTDNETNLIFISKNQALEMDSDGNCIGGATIVKIDNHKNYDSKNKKEARKSTADNQNALNNQGSQCRN